MVVGVFHLSDAGFEPLVNIQHEEKDGEISVGGCRADQCAHVVEFHCAAPVVELVLDRFQGAVVEFVQEGLVVLEKKQSNHIVVSALGLNFLGFEF